MITATFAPSADCRSADRSSPGGRNELINGETVKRKAHQPNTAIVASACAGFFFHSPRSDHKRGFKVRVCANEVFSDQKESLTQF